MKRLLIQLDGDRLPSAFDRIVAYDAGADHVLSYGGVREEDVTGLVHGAIFTRGPKDLARTALFIGGSDVASSERLLAVAQRAFFGPFRTSVMVDPNGANTTAAAVTRKVVAAVD
ncbi:MAG: methylene-tetrahydromethanopterin dehydrogenase N-terminal domain-containing protein, partial [Longimicrobiales bacterium]